MNVKGFAAGLMLLLGLMLIGCSSGLTEAEVEALIQERVDAALSELGAELLTLNEATSSKLSETISSKILELKEGPTGPTGGTGPQGAQGPGGPIGPGGIPGTQGEQGPAGPLGQTGTSGPQGAVGPYGPVGPRGFTGPTADLSDYVKKVTSTIKIQSTCLIFVPA